MGCMWFEELCCLHRHGKDKVSTLPTDLRLCVNNVSDYENQILIQFEYGLNPVLAPAVERKRNCAKANDQPSLCTGEVGLFPVFYCYGSSLLIVWAEVICKDSYQAVFECLFYNCVLSSACLLIQSNIQ